MTLANLTALRADVVPEGGDAHLLAFAGDLADRTGSAPEYALLLQHYEALTHQGDPNGLAVQTRLLEVGNLGVPQPSVTEYRHQLDQFRETTVGDALATLLQQGVSILTTGLAVPASPGQPKKTLKGAKEALQFLEQGMATLNSQWRSGDIQGTLRDLAQVFSRYQQRHGGATTGVFSGYDSIDSIHADGLVPGDLALVLGFTSQMKSTFVFNWAYNAAILYGKNVGLLSLETSIRGLQDTFVTMHCQHPKWDDDFGLLRTVNYNRLRRGELTPDEERLVQAVIEDLKINKTYGQLVYKEPDKSLTVGDVYRWAEQEDKKIGLDLLCVDYWALVNPTGGGISLRESAIANIAMREAKQAAMSFRQGAGIPTLSPIQSNREGYKAAVKNGGVYELTALAWAPEAEKSADLVYSVYRSRQLADSYQLQMGNLKARDRQQILDTWILMADPALKIIQNYDPTRVWQQPVNMNP